MSVKWNGFEIKNVDSKPLLEKILVTYHMYKDLEILPETLIREIGKTWDFLEEEHYKQTQPQRRTTNDN